MSEHLDKCFSSAKLNGLRLRNRLIKAGTFEGMTPGGLPGERLEDFHRTLAMGGVAMKEADIKALVQPYHDAAVFMKSVGFDALMAQGFDFIQLGRTLLGDPDLPNMASNDNNYKSRCNHCNECVATIEHPEGIHCPCYRYWSFADISLSTMHRPFGRGLSGATY